MKESLHTTELLIALVHTMIRGICESCERTVRLVNAIMSRATNTESQYLNVYYIPMMESIASNKFVFLR